MDKIKIIREFLKAEYGIKNDRELVKALETCKFIERGFLTNGGKNE